MDLSELESMTPARALRRRFELEAALEGLPSPIGFQLQSIQEQTIGPGHNGGRPDGQERLRIQYMDYLRLSADLNSDEVEVCRMRYRELTTPEHYEANRRLGEFQEGDGEEIISHDVVGQDGQPLVGWVRVKGVRQRFPKYDRIAEVLAERGRTNADGQPMTAGAVEKRHRTATEKVSAAIQWKRFQLMTEENAE